MKMSTMDWIAWVLLVVGGLNWGLVGIAGSYDWDLVAKIFGGADNIVARIIYILVGLSALWLLVSMFSKNSAGSDQ